ncbi:polar amino acid transport system substrate-binding protein [Crossiella equi]|uniref:Polar amino acid transport system substrate-binding protein n=1 Tax=Crossiella equi TaxID=130796 RepID=A0ABS5ACJ0_9PSEU|nr:transporter substrate-binding domain-containing protein [Crossiella equi]MBP2474286.1 polar amino acid transport system substrate-binding protein [Crossiella equi]
MRVSTLAATAALALAVSACAPVDQAGQPSPSGAQGCAKANLKTVAGGKFTFGTDQPVYEPWFSGDDPANGKGFEGAVAYAVAGRLGFAKDEVAWVRVPFNAAIQPGPKTFDADLNEFSITDERRNAVDFSSPYYTVRQAVVAIKGSAGAGARSVADLAKLKLGAQVGTTSYDAIANQVKPSQQAGVYNNNDDAKAALRNNQVQAIVVDLPTAFYITGAEMPDAVIVGQLPAGGGKPEQFGAVLDKGSRLTPCFSQAVDALRADGTLAKLEQEWLASAGKAPELT